MNKKDKLGTKRVRWDLTVLYTGIDDPQLELDIKRYERRAKRFAKRFRGRLKRLLGPALVQRGKLKQLREKIFCYLQLALYREQNNEAVKTKQEEADRRILAADAEHLEFFFSEVAWLTKKTVNRLYHEDPQVAWLRPWIEDRRGGRTAILNEDAEKSLTRREAFGSAAWILFYDEWASNLNFRYYGHRRTEAELDTVLWHSQNQNARAEALRAKNEGHKGDFAQYAARMLQIIAGEKRVDDCERHYDSPVSERNAANDLSDTTVKSLCRTVTNDAVPLAARYYRLKATLLGLPRLHFSDRLAPLPFTHDNALIPFPKAMRMVIKAFSSFSPTLAGLVQEMRAQKRIDAPDSPDKQNDNFCTTFSTPEHRALSFIMLHYLGSATDVISLAHELGHATQELLATQTQHPLLSDVGVVCGEIASIFAQRLVYDFLREEALTKDDLRTSLALLCQELEDNLYSTVRQIGITNFELRLHNTKRLLSVQDICDMWNTTTEETYGPDGDVFIYKNTDHLWAAFPVLCMPFYTYSYAFDDLVVSLLHKSRVKLGPRFEPMYLNFLRAGGSKGTDKLLKSLGVDVDAPKIWSRAIRIGIERRLKEAEDLARKLGYKVP